MLIAVLGLLGAIFSVTSGAKDIADYYRPNADVELGKLKAACANRFASFNPDTGLWYGGKTGKWAGWHYCPPRGPRGG